LYDEHLDADAYIIELYGGDDKTEDRVDHLAIWNAYYNRRYSLALTPTY